MKRKQQNTTTPKGSEITLTFLFPLNNYFCCASAESIPKPGAGNLPVDKQKVPLLMEHSPHKTFHIVNSFTNSYTEDKAPNIRIFQANTHLHIQQGPILSVYYRVQVS